MKIDVIGPLHVRVTPHDYCKTCDHTVIVTGMPVMPTEEIYATVSWGPNAFLGLSTSREFGEAVLKACEIGEQMQRDRGYRE